MLCTLGSAPNKSSHEVFPTGGPHARQECSCSSATKRPAPACVRLLTGNARSLDPGSAGSARPISSPPGTRSSAPATLPPPNPRRSLGRATREGRGILTIRVDGARRHLPAARAQRRSSSESTRLPRPRCHRRPSIVQKLIDDEAPAARAAATASTTGSGESRDRSRASKATGSQAAPTRLGEAISRRSHREGVNVASNIAATISCPCPAGGADMGAKAR